MANSSYQLAMAAAMYNTQQTGPSTTGASSNTASQGRGVGSSADPSPQGIKLPSQIIKAVLAVDSTIPTTQDVVPPASRLCWPCIVALKDSQMLSDEEIEWAHEKGELPTHPIGGSEFSSRPTCPAQLRRKEDIAFRNEAERLKNKISKRVRRNKLAVKHKETMQQTKLLMGKYKDLLPHDGTIEELIKMNLKFSGGDMRNGSVLVPISFDVPEFTTKNSDIRTVVHLALTGMPRSLFQLCFECIGGTQLAHVSQESTEVMVEKSKNGYCVTFTFRVEKVIHENKPELADLSNSKVKIVVSELMKPERVGRKLIEVLRMRKTIAQVEEVAQYLSASSQSIMSKSAPGNDTSVPQPPPPPADTVTNKRLRDGSPPAFQSHSLTVPGAINPNILPNRRKKARK
eukprot:m.20227 g.20227  ORF g.20227 m.20227 type:complete len:401 (+) comp6781_c0_seq1:160-1362(+)